MNDALWPPDEHEGAGAPRARQLREIDDLRNVRQVVAGEGHHVRLPLSRSRSIRPCASPACRSMSRTW